MKPLKDLFAEQTKVKNLRRHHKDVVTKETYIYFEINGGYYAVAIAVVREITDSYALTPYPEEQPGHVGIVSLRGRVLPVIAPPFFGSSLRAAVRGAPQGQPERKLLVLEFADDATFCIIVERVRKILVSQDETSRHSVINVQDRPVRITSKMDFDLKDKVV